MFSALKQGSQIYILNKKDGLNLSIGEVISVTAPTNYTTFNPNNYMDTKVDINIKVDGSNIELKQLGSNLSIATDPISGTIISETKELMSLEVDNIVQSSKRILENIPYHKKVINNGEDILKKLNPRYAKEQERDEDISNLKAKVGGMESKLDKIFDLLTTKSETNK